MIDGDDDDARRPTKGPAWSAADAGRAAVADLVLVMGPTDRGAAPSLCGVCVGNSAER